MLWEEYYDKLSDWATSTAVSRILPQHAGEAGDPECHEEHRNSIQYDSQIAQCALIQSNHAHTAFAIGEMNDKP